MLSLLCNRTSVQYLMVQSRRFFVLCDFLLPSPFLNDIFQTISWWFHLLITCNSIYFLPTRNRDDVRFIGICLLTSVLQSGVGASLKKHNPSLSGQECDIIDRSHGYTYSKTNKSRSLFDRHRIVVVVRKSP